MLEKDNISPPGKEPEENETSESGHEDLRKIRAAILRAIENSEKKPVGKHEKKGDALPLKKEHPQEPAAPHGRHLKKQKKKPPIADAFFAVAMKIFSKIQTPVRSVSSWRLKQAKKPSVPKKARQQTVKKSGKGAYFFSWKDNAAAFGLNLILTLVLVGGLLLFLGGLLVYTNKIFSAEVRESIIHTISYPAGIVNTHFISLSDWEDTLRAHTRFYEVQVASNIYSTAPEPAELENAVWERFVQNALVEEIADEYGVEVSEDDVMARVDEVTREAGDSGNFVQYIQYAYGWPLDQFESKVIKPFLLSEKVRVAVRNDKKLRKQKREFARDLVREVRKQPEQFADFSKKYSEDASSAALGGDMGFFSETVVEPEIVEALRNLEEGEISDIIETTDGYEIFFLEEKLMGDDGKLRFKARRILVSYPTLEEVLLKKRKSAVIYRFVK